MPQRSRWLSGRNIPPFFWNASSHVKHRPRAGIPSGKRDTTIFSLNAIRKRYFSSCIRLTVWIEGTAIWLTAQITSLLCGTGGQVELKTPCYMLKISENECLSSIRIPGHSKHSEFPSGRFPRIRCLCLRFSLPFYARLKRKVAGKVAFPVSSGIISLE